MEALVAAGTPVLPADGMMGPRPSETVVAAGKQIKKTFGTVVMPPDILSKFKGADPKTSTIHEPGFVANMAAQVTESKTRSAALQEQMARTAQALTPDATRAEIVSAVNAQSEHLIALHEEMRAARKDENEHWDTAQVQRGDDEQVHAGRWTWERNALIISVAVGVLALIAAIVAIVVAINLAP